MEWESSVKTFELVLFRAKLGSAPNPSCVSYTNFLVLKQDIQKQGGLASYIQNIERQRLFIEPLLCIEPLVLRANKGDQVQLSLTDLTDLTNLTSIINLTEESEHDIPRKPSFTASFTATVPGILHLQDCLSSCHEASQHPVPDLKGILIVEDADTSFHDIRTGNKLLSGTKAVIRRKNGTAFREFVLLIHDFCINGLSEPLHKRLQSNDSVYCFSSVIHGDPATPILETYPGDEIIIRVIHNDKDHPLTFSIAGLPHQTKSPHMIHIDKPYAPGDYLYYLGDDDSRKMGLWGLLRVYRSPDKDLKPLSAAQTSFALPDCPNLIHADNTSDRCPIIRPYAAAVTQTKSFFLRHHTRRDDIYLVPVPYKPGTKQNLRKLKAYCRFALLFSRKKKKTFSLTINANHGDWIAFTLYNLLDPSGGRISLSPQTLSFDPIYHAGINVGRNQWEQSVEPCHHKTYLWHVPADSSYICTKNASCPLILFGNDNFKII